MEEFELFRNVVRNSVKKAEGAIIAGYKVGNNYAHEGLALLTSESKIMRDAPEHFDVIPLFYATNTTNPDKKSWVPEVQRNMISSLGWYPKTIEHILVCRIKKQTMVYEITRAMVQYAKSGEASSYDKDRPNPYFNPIFAKPIARGLKNGYLEMVFPADQAKRSEAAAHLDELR